MVLRLRRYSFIVRGYVKSSRQQERRFYMCYQKKYLSSMAPSRKHQTYIRRKFDEFIAWYDEFTGMDAVRAAQYMVLEDEERFRKAQDHRRDVLNQLTEIQHKLKDLYAELENTARGDDRYVLLVTQEHKLLKEEKLILEKFNAAEKAEREAFTSLSSSVKLSHEKERAQSERTKYWSIIGSVLGTVLGILGSSINNHFKMKELKELIKNSTNSHLIDYLNSYLDANEKLLQQYKTGDMAVNETNGTDVVDEKLKKLSNRLIDIELSLKEIERNTRKDISETVSDTDKVSIVTAGGLEESLKKDYAQLKVLVSAVALLSILMPIVSKYS